MAETRRYYYNYALIDEFGWCYEVRSSSRNCDGMEGYIRIPEYNQDYLEKYYNVNNGKWYWDADFTQEWIPE